MRGPGLHGHRAVATHQCGHIWLLLDRLVLQDLAAQGVELQLHLAPLVPDHLPGQGGAAAAPVHLR